MRTLCRRVWLWWALARAARADRRAMGRVGREKVTQLRIALRRARKRLDMADRVFDVADLRRSMLAAREEIAVGLRESAAYDVDSRPAAARPGHIHNSTERTLRESDH